MENTKHQKQINDIFFLILIPLFAAFSTELIHRGTIGEVFEWIINYKGEFFINFLLFFGIINVFYLFYRKVYLGLSIAILSIVFIGSFVSTMKIRFRGEPLLPWDLQLGKEASDISSYLGEIVSVKMIVLTIIVVLIFATLIYFLPKKEHDKQTSMVVFGLSVLMIITIVTDKPFTLNQSVGIETITWDQGIHFQQNGFLLGFVLDAKWLKIKEPRSYNKKKINEIVKNVSNNNGIDQGQKPNVVFVMSEAFWDPTLMKGVKFSQDPIPYFHKLQKESTHGTMIAPVYGGGTVNTEFEALTGFSTHFLPSGAIAYAQYIHKPLDSLASIYSSQGYQSTAIHTYHNWFYGRNNVYKNLGFDNFVSAEFFNNPARVGEFIADREIMDRVLGEIRTSEKPDFIYAVTMQNHGPYPLGKNTENKIKVSGKLTNEAKDILETYSQTVSDADKSLEQLVNGLKEMNEPTVVVFFGDHLPMLGQDYQVYKEANYFKDGKSREEYAKMYGVPYVIWDNFSDKKEKIKISPNFFGQYILELTNQKGTVFTNYLNGLYKDGITFIPREDLMKTENITDEKLEPYKLLQYDQMFGEEYLYGTKSKPAIEENFRFGSEPLIIEKSNPVRLAEEGRKTIGSTIIKGKGFVSQMQLFVDGEPVATNFIDKNTVSVEIPEESRKVKKELPIQLRVVDSLNNILAQSNEKTILVVEERLVKEHFKKEAKKIKLSQVKDWEYFSSKKEVHVVRTLLYKNEKDYILEKDGVPLQHKNADDMDLPEQSDIYPNGYLYLTIEKEKLPRELTNDDIVKYFNQENYVLYVSE